MKIIHFYVLSRFAATLLAMCTLIVGLFFISWLMEDLRFFLNVSERTSFKEYILYFLWDVPYTLNFIYPLAAVFSIVFTLGRMHAFNEVISMYNAGKSILYLCYPVLIFIFLLSTVLLIFEDPFLYGTHLKHLDIKKKMMGRTNQTKVVQTNLTLYGQNNKIYLISTYHEDSATMKNVSIVYLNDENDFSKIISAKTIQYDPEAKTWKGQQITTRTFKNKGKVRFKFRRREAFDLDEVPSDFESETHNRAIDLSAKQSKRIANKFRIIGGNYRRWDVEYHFKIATPYVPLVILLLGIPVAVFSRRATTVFSLLMMTGIMFLFIVFIYIGRSLGINGVLPPLIAGWFGHIVFVILSYVTFKFVRL